jgi:hypothetical protein
MQTMLFQAYSIDTYPEGGVIVDVRIPQPYECAPALPEGRLLKHWLQGRVQGLTHIL